MKAKLTLSVDKSVIKKARAISRNQKRSISALFEEYIERLYEINDTAEKKPPSILLSKGIIKWKYAEQITYKELIKNKEDKSAR
jgi:hypothetical protein